MTIKKARIAVLAGVAAVGGTVTGNAAMPPNQPAAVHFDSRSRQLTLTYGGKDILQATVETTGQSSETIPRISVKTDVGHGIHATVEQRITLSSTPSVALRLRGDMAGGDDLIAAETQSAAQARFRCLRTTVGRRSDNLRNNAIYDRAGDWMLEGPSDFATRLEPLAKGYRLRVSGSTISLIFRPRYYQRHKNIPDFDPSQYTVWKDSVTGWCSWWAYYNEITEKDIRSLVDVFDQKHLRDFGYRYIQMDDGFQQEPRGPVSHWLEWDKTKFPGGLDAYVKMIRERGLDPGLWISVNFGDEAVVKAHPDFFARDTDGMPHKGPWIDWPLDATNAKALNEIVRPVYRALHEKGVTYVKIDTLRHLLYDGYTHIPTGGFSDKKATAETAYRAYIQAVRDELGPKTFLLSCWGILPESAGIMDGCRLGTDGFGPATLQQYNSWNGIVWRSDPDHCDILPFREYKGTIADTIVRPVLVSMAGGILMLSDKPEVYADDKNLEGIKRSSPILFSVPGQLYDYDPRKSDILKTLDPPRATTGSGPTKIDADQFGSACEWWLQEIDRPFERWNVLGRLAWDKPLPASTVRFADMGLDPKARYDVYEFWTKTFVGSFKGEFPAMAQDARTVRNYSIRRYSYLPHILSTNRHISQGGVDLEDVAWNATDKVMTGRSSVVKDDRYSITLYTPKGTTVTEATFDGHPAEVTKDAWTTVVSFVSVKTVTVPWMVRFAIDSDVE